MIEWTLGDDYFMSGEVCHLLGCSRQAIHDRVKHRSILRVDTHQSKNRWRYPTFQFVALNRVHPALKLVLREWDRAGRDELCDDELCAFLASRVWMLDGEDSLELLLEETRAEALRLLDVD